MISVIVFLPMKTSAAYSFLLYAFSVLILSVMPGCAGNVPLSDDSMRIRNTVDIVNQMENLYENRDEGLLSLFTPEYLSEAGHRDAILNDMKRSSSISMLIFIERIEIDKDIVNVTVHWNGSWSNGGKTIRSGGSAVLVLTSGNGLNIADIKGDSPFGKINED